MLQFYNKRCTLKRTKGKTRNLHIIKTMTLTAPSPSVDGPPRKAIILAPEPGTQIPNREAAKLRAVLVHLDGRSFVGTGQGSF